MRDIEYRLATAEDAAAIAAIYAPYVRDTIISFETEAQDAAEIAARIERIGRQYPWLVASADGRVYLQRDFGDPDKNDRSEVVSAVPRADGTLALTINFPSIGQARLNVYTKAEGRVRVVYNSRSDNSDVTVENGVLRHNGQPTPWSQRCR